MTYKFQGLQYIASPGIVIPLLVLLILIIYYLLSLTGALREANNDLKIQLRRERTEERRKMFKMAGKKDDTPKFGKWESLLPMMNPKTTGEMKEKRASILTTGKMTGFAGANGIIFRFFIRFYFHEFLKKYLLLFRCCEESSIKSTTNSGICSSNGCRCGCGRWKCDRY